MASLEQDYTTVPGQIFACISLVGPDCPQKTDKFGLKIRGCFATRDEAANHAKRLQKEDATFDIEYPAGTTGPYRGRLDLDLEADWRDTIQVAFKHSDPTSFGLLGYILKSEVSGS